MKSRSGTLASGLHFETRGTGPRLVLLHGGPGADHRYLLPQWETLGDEYELFLYDQRGSGQSREGAALPTWQSHVEDLEAVRVELKESSLLLAGYSFGGLLALLYAVSHPTRVRALVLAAPAPCTFRYRAEFETTLSERTQRKEATGLHGFAKAVSGYFADPRLAPQLTPFLVRQKVQQSVQQSLGNYDFCEEMSALAMPTLILHGRVDPIPIRYSEELAGRMKNARFVPIAECGHVPFVEAPQLFFSEIRRFLAELTNDRP